MIFNQDPLRYGVVMKLGLIPMKFGTKSYVFTSYFKVNGCGRFKLDIDDHYDAYLLSLPTSMGNASYHP